jgi:hypothetical protein
MTSVFLSYARNDDEPFVRRLHADLKKAGFDAWFDKDDLRSRGLPFHQEIKDAVRLRDRLIYIGGPRATASPYVREEWQFALAEDKPVIPILRLGVFESVIPGALAEGPPSAATQCELRDRRAWPRGLVFAARSQLR